MAGTGNDEDRKRCLAGEVEDQRDPVAGGRDRGIDVDEDCGQGDRVGKPCQGPQPHLAQLHHLPQEQKVAEEAYHHRELNRDGESIERR